ncbi:spatacsin isoform X1 [Pseudoliparis swirei]|uniref:spatacsin isoform X1 n=1 Tax=Pseudoliparis swirei TaxID=2059687 RepID=UPI0024BE5EAE|nr:spatacsin isoform X1 [Pseudoliparis swirei]
MMLEERSSLEVCVIPENRHCGGVTDIRRAALAPGGSLLGCLGLRGRLVVWNPADREAPPAAVDGCYADFSWEEEEEGGGASSSSSSLLAVGTQGEVTLLRVEAEPSSSIRVLRVSGCPAERLLQTVREQDPDVRELQSVHVLSFAAGRGRVLLNRDWLLQLRWRQTGEEPQPQEEEPQPEEEEELQTVSCCSIRQSDDSSRSSVHHCVCSDFLFVLSATGLIAVHHVSDGRLQASIDLPAYLTFLQLEDNLVSSSPSSSLCPPSSSPSPSFASSSSFCLLQVTPDLSTVVAVTQSHTAVAIDLDRYFSLYPDHLLCAAAPLRPPIQNPLRFQTPTDQDGLSSAVCSLSGLGAPFSADRSWETRLASMYSRAQKSAAPSSSSSSSSSSSWSSSLHPPRPPRAGSSAHSRVPRGVATVTFSAPKHSAPSLLAVSEFSAQLTFASPGNRRTTVALWDFESGSVSHHEAQGEAAPVQHWRERQHRLLLKDSGLFQVLFSVTQQELLSRLMLFGSAATVDAVCHLNSWGRCSIPVHALQAGLKNRQLDTVDFYLKSKEKLLVPEAEEPEASRRSLSHRFQDLSPALDLLCSAVRDSHSEAQSRQFSEQLLNVTTSFINTQVRSVLSNTQLEDEGVRGCVDALDLYVTELRSYMKKFPWPAGGDATDSADRIQKEKEEEEEEEAQRDEWEQLPTEEVVRQSVLTNQIPRAQAVLRRRSRPEQRLSALRMEGLRQVFCCLQDRDLQTASTLLVNMGFSVKEQLHSVCLHTDDKNLRQFVVEELSGRSHFPGEELQSVAFIREMERLGSLPAARRHAEATPLRPVQVQMVPREPGGGDAVLEELLGQRRSAVEEQEQKAGLWRNLRLDWVRNWDPSCQTAVLLSRRHHTEVTSCDPAVLWRYLTALHDQRRVVDWIQDQQTPGGSRWPELTPELVDDNTACSTYMREQILDLLARRGLFVPEELADLDQLLWRLAQGGGVMAPAPQVPQYRSPLGLDLHSLFISFCVDRGLQYLLYTYLEHHRLTPRNCPLLTNQSLSESRPWFDMLVKIQEITRDLSDPGLVFQASLTSAQVLLPGNQASLSSLLLEGHSLLALAAIMFAPGGINQVVVQGERPGRAEGTVDPQLLKMALAPHPKLRAALFPSGPRGTGPSSDVSVYHLLQSLHPLDPTRLFGWQAANTLNSTETSELPHFSSPHLVGRFALVENLDFLYYLRHGRPSFAFATFLVQQLSVCSDVPLLLQQVWQQTYSLALQSFNVPSVTSASVCFCELLGVSSLKLRVDVRASNAIMQHWSQDNTRTLHTLVSKAEKLAEAEPGAAEELIGYLEAAVTDSLEQKGIGRSSYEAAQEWALPVQFCQLHRLQLSSVFPARCAEDGQFIHFLLFVQLHSFPPPQVRSLAARFGPTLRAHLSLAFQDLQASGPRGRRPVSPTGTPEHPRELFQVLLQSQEEAEPCRYLLQEALVQRCPTLAVMAACQQGEELLPGLCVWLLTSVDAAASGEAAAHLADAPQHHEWTLHDLSVIWRTLLGRGHVRPLLRGFELFQRDCPLVLVLRMFELCCDFRKFSEAKEKLLDFQRTLITLRNGGAAPPGGLPLQWVESQASVLLLAMLRRASSPYDRHRLLQLLAGVDKLLKSNGPDFRKLSQLSQLLQGSEVSLSPRLLECSSPSVQQEEFQAAVDALQAGGRYGQARRVALLAGLPVQRLLLSQLHQEATSQRSKRQWRRLETRVGLWRRCHERLRAEGADPESASRFFLSQAEPPEAGSDLLAVQERCLLLCLAARWLSLLRPPPAARLRRLEEELWAGRARRHVLAAAVEEQSVFSPPPPGATPETDPYAALMKEFSFSDVSGLNTDSCLRLEGLPGPGEDREEPGTAPPLSPEERSALAALVGQLLEEGSVHEASRVCRYFSLYHRDVWLVLRCRGVASGELEPEPLEEEEGLPRKSMTSSPSMSSLLSFVMLPLPEDEVAGLLQKLVDQCRHGKNYCRQVLGLYQLSKELQCSFLQMCREEPRSALEKLLLSEQPERFRKARAFVRAQGLGADAVAQLVAGAVVRALLAGSAHELQPERQVFRPSEGRDSLVQLVKLCDDPNLVGVKLLEHLNGVHLRDLSCIVELLVVAHDCFSLTCNMEGIVRVLQAARHLSHAYLAPGEHYGLLVRLLTGVGRYNEMTYVFDLLHQNHRFEMLLRKKMDIDRGQTSSLKTALLDYLRRCLPADSEKHNMVALCFSMRREIGENHEMAARTQLKIIESQPWVVTPDLKSSLVKVLGLLRDAAESYSKDSCVRQATRCVSSAKLVCLQLHFLNSGSELRVVHLRAAELLEAVTALPRCYQVHPIILPSTRYIP